MKKIICVAVAMVCLFISCFTVSATSDADLPPMEQGAIGADGKTEASKTALRTTEFIGLSDYEGIGVTKGYEINLFVYDVDKDLLGNTGYMGDGFGATTAKLMAIYPMGVYFKLSLKKADNSEISILEVFNAGLRYYTLGEQMPESVMKSANDFSAEDVMDIGDWSEGAVFDNKLFTIGQRGSGSVFDLATKQKLADLSMDNNFSMALSTNSVCFGTEFYDKKDNYPLLYVNLHNDFGGFMSMPFGAMCCVFRITESDGTFGLKLVQVIRIEFDEQNQEDSWMPMYGARGRGDSSANFVVDTDNEKLYAYKTNESVTTFYKFDLPKLKDGKDNVFFECKEVELGKGDIKEQFDVAPFNNMQGVGFIDGKIISAEGMGASKYTTSAIKVIDLKKKAVVKAFYPAIAEITTEPAIIATDSKNGAVYFAADDGKLRRLTCLGENSGEDKVNKKPNKTVTVILLGGAAIMLIAVASGGLFTILKKKSKTKQD